MGDERGRNSIEWEDTSSRARGEAEPPLRILRITKASEIKIRPVHWLWADRVALGTLGLIAGREGIGKSTCAYALCAYITRGRLPGAFEGKPMAVIIAASEDSWEHTIVPRLMAAGADLNLVYRIDVETFEGVHTDLSLPRDLRALQDTVIALDAVLILLDPLMSRLDSKLDTHKDAEVRLALEPLVRLADATGTAILGLIHVNKSMSTDPLTTVMASRAFAAVARSVLFVVKDPDDDMIRYFGQPKNNLGRTDLPTLIFSIESALAAQTDQGPIYTGRIKWIGEDNRSIAEVLESAGETTETRSAVGEAATWLTWFLTGSDGIADHADIKDEGKKAGHTLSALKRARARLHIISESQGFPRRTTWRLPGGQSSVVGPAGGESEATELTGLTDSRVGLVSPVSAAPARTCPDCNNYEIPEHHKRCDECTQFLIDQARTT